MEQVGWYNPGTKRLCYLDEKTHANQRGFFDGYTQPVYINVARQETSESPGTDLQQRLNAIADVLECLHDGDNVSNDKFVRGKLLLVRGNCT